MRTGPRPSSLVSGDSPPTVIPSPHPLPRRTQSFHVLPSSSIPFSWEHEPGIPKNPRKPDIHHKNPDRIPLPPPIRLHSKKKQPEADPFAAALAECAKEPRPADPELENFLRRGSSAARKRRTTVWSVAGGLSLLGFYGSCKAAAAACSVVNSTVQAPPRTRSVNRLLR